jgi:hypothetical protein
MSIIRGVKDGRLDQRSITLSIDILQNPRLSIKGKGYYAMLESGGFPWDDVPLYIQDELEEVGYCDEEVGL